MRKTKNYIWMPLVAAIGSFCLVSCDLAVVSPSHRTISVSKRADASGSPLRNGMEAGAETAPSTFTPAFTPAPAASAVPLPDDREERPSAGAPFPFAVAKPSEPDAERPAPESGNHASLSGAISLGMSDADVRARLGAPADVYTVADSFGSVQMHEYDDLTVGYGPDGHVVYVEIVSASVPTGIAGLTVGEDEAQAAAALGVEVPSDSNVLSATVDQGWIKADVDPSTRKVLSVRLLKKEYKNDD